MKIFPMKCIPALVISDDVQKCKSSCSLAALSLANLGGT